MSLHKSEISYLLQREKEERALARDCPEGAAQDAHSMLADHYADRAWAHGEKVGEDFVPCPIWRSVPD